MGIYDSSKTRVVPAFNFLRAADRTGRSWLPKLLTLPIGGSAVHLPADCDYTIQGNCFWGECERKLAPPVALLSWLIRHPEELARSSAANKTPMHPKRHELLNGSSEIMMETLDLLRRDSEWRGERWYIFEGETQPDVFVETESLMMVIEGKRTELRPTTHTSWMGGRHQMIRHLDCAWEIRGKKQVIGFFIVEGESGGEEIPREWRTFASETINAKAIASSLPHRGPEEQREIASCFAGVTTWGRVCKEFRIDSSILKDCLQPGTSS